MIGRATLLLLIVAYCACAISSYKAAGDPVVLPDGMVIPLSVVSPGPYGNDFKQPAVRIRYVNDDIIQVKFYDEAEARWEVPNISKLPPSGNTPQNMKYKFSYTASPFRFTVTRLSDSAKLFESSEYLVLSDQFLAVNNTIPADPYIFGLGERTSPLRLPMGYSYSMYSQDRGTPYMKNIYGIHPFYMELRKGKAHGVFLLNSNLMDVILNPTQLGYAVTGGILDFYVFVGTKPMEVIEQYTSLIGKPYFPPYWGLGWQQCRWGYKNLSETEAVVKNYQKYNIPLEVMWNDIDYMDGYRDFTTDPVNYPLADFRAFVDRLHAGGMKYICMTDPGIKIEQGYAPYDDGLVLDLFIKNQSGLVWPGATYFPDFTHPATESWWAKYFKQFHEALDFDGIWLDMNEVANFCPGECSFTNPPNKYDEPPYLIANGGDHINQHTIYLSAIQYASRTYNVHNLYGHDESVVTNRIFGRDLFPKKRNVIITRSSFASTGHHVGHWLGDNNSEWEDLYLSIPGVLNMGFFGIPFVGADICGFGGATTEQLCTRWIQLGAFYTFSRNHNSIGQPSQEPYAFGPQTAKIAAEVIEFKYSILPLYYTLFYHAHLHGRPVLRPLFAEYSADPNTWALDKQFMIGHHLLVTPVLTENATTVTGYFPAGVWYSVYGDGPANITSLGRNVSLPAPITSIPIYLRGGAIVPTQLPAATTVAARTQDLGLWVALGPQGAEGEYYNDDGENADAVRDGQHVLVRFQAHTGVFKSTPLHSFAHLDAALTTLKSVTVFGVEQRPKHAQLNNVEVPHIAFNNGVLVLSGFEMNLLVANTLTWS